MFGQGPAFVLTLAGVLFGDPVEGSSCRVLTEGVAPKSELKIAPERYVAIFSHLSGITVVGTDSGRVLWQKKGMRIADVVFVTKAGSDMMLICGGEDFDDSRSLRGRVWCFDAKTGKEITQLGHSFLEPVRNVTLSQSNKKVAILCSTLGPSFSSPNQVLRQEVYLWDLVSAKPALLTKGRFSAIMFAMSDDRLVLSNSSRDQVTPFGSIIPARQTLVDFDVATKKQKALFSVGPYRELKASDDSSKIAVSMDGATPRIDIWNLGTRSRLAKVPNRLGKFLSIAISHSSDLIAITARDGSGEVEIWKLSEKRDRFAFKHNCPIKALGFSPDDRALFFLNEEGKLCLYSLPERLAAR